jgi:hypothetical protein
VDPNEDLAYRLADMQQRILALADQNETFGATLHSIDAGIQSLAKMLAHEYLLDELCVPDTLTQRPFRLDRQGRRYLAIFTPVTITNIAVDLMGVTGYTLTLSPGWNVINAPNGTTLTAPNGTNQAIVIKATNYSQAGAI